MDVEENGWRFLWDLHSKRLKNLLDGDMRNALVWQARQQQERDSEVGLEEETELLLRAYLQVLNAEEECEQLLSRRRGEAEFWMLVSAAAEARERMEVVERQRQTGGGFFEGVADALEKRNARARARLRADDDAGGEVGAALGLAPSPPSPVMSVYEELVAATRATRAAAKKTAREMEIVIRSVDDDDGPGGL